MRVFNEIIQFIEWLFIEHNTKGLKILITWMSLGLLFALIEMWTRNL